MKATDCVRLEKDKKFRLEYFKQTKWWKNILFVAPACFLFLGLFGLLYLLRYEMLISFYVIPFILFFIIGTIWLKAVKRHLQKTKIADDNAFQICQAKMIEERGGYIHTIFVTGNKRHNDHYISNLAKDISLDKISKDEIARSKRNPVLLHNDEDDTEFYLKTFFNRDITRRNTDWRDEDCIPILFIDEKYLMIIKKIDMD